MDNEKLFDQRTYKRNIAKGLISEKEYEKYLKSLKDSKENAEEINLEDENEEEKMPSSKDFE